MARRQAYSHLNQPIPTGAPKEPDSEEAFSLADGGIQVNLGDDDGQLPPQQGSEPEIQPQRRDPEPAPPEDEAFLRLKQQLERSNAEKLEAQRRYEQEQRTSQDALRQERERNERMQVDYLATQKLAIDNAIRAAEREADAAERAFAEALNLNDSTAAVAAQKVITQAYHDLSRLKDGKLSIESQEREPARAQPTYEAPKPDPVREPATEWERVEAYITQPAHSPRVQEYMRSHYDDLFRDGAARTNELVGAHFIAKARGIAENSDEYFNFLDGHMGYDKAAKDRAAAPVPVQNTPKPRSHVPPAAPVSRAGSNNSKSASGMTVDLTPAQAAFLRESGIDPVQYAKNKLALDRAGQDPNYTGPRWTRDMGSN